MITRVVTSAEMREIDRVSIDEFGIPSSVLMNNAGKSIAGFVADKFHGKKIYIFCGTGNNGGDGFTAAYYLHNRGFSAEIFMSGKKDKLSDTSRIFMMLCEKMNICINEIDEENLSSISLNGNGVIIDAILGTGFEGTPKGIQLDFIRIINKSDKTVISVDIPSGLGSDGIPPTGECVIADYTITIGLPKISLVTYPCIQYCGELIVADIGFPLNLTLSEKLKVTLIDKNLFTSIPIFNTNQDIHKGDKGHSLVIGGFINMEGAAILTARALFNSGCGLVTIATMEESRKIIAGKIPEAMTLSLPEDSESSLINEFIRSKNISSIVIGPGMGRNFYPENIFNNLINTIENTSIKRVLIDGDGLFHLAGFLTERRLPDSIDFIITPHFMEASRILKKDISTIKSNRLLSCNELAVNTGCTTVLKGPATIVSDGNISFINTSGNSALATAGSGDVLSGIIGAFMNYKITPIQAAAAGVYIHGGCADLYTENSAATTMTASDILNNIKAVIKMKTAL